MHWTLSIVGFVLGMALPLPLSALAAFLVIVVYCVLKSFDSRKYQVAAAFGYGGLVFSMVARCLATYDSDHHFGLGVLWSLVILAISRLFYLVVEARYLIDKNTYISNGWFNRDDYVRKMSKEFYLVAHMQRDSPEPYVFRYSPRLFNEPICFGEVEFDTGCVFSEVRDVRMYSGNRYAAMNKKTTNESGGISYQLVIVDLVAKSLYVPGDLFDGSFEVEDIVDGVIYAPKPMDDRERQTAVSLTDIERIGNRYCLQEEGGKWHEI